jgi:hypothetical protein
MPMIRDRNASVKAVLRARKFQPGLETLEGRTVLSPTNPLTPTTIEPEDPEEIIERAVQQAIRRVGVDTLREMWEAEQRIERQKPVYFPEFDPPAEVDERSWWDAVYDAIDAAIDARTPIFHP